MSEFRDLQAKLEKIDESYYSRLAAAADDIALYNQRMPTDELVELIRKELGDQAAEYIGDKLAKGGRIEEKEDKDVEGVNDKYDPETLNCKHCGDYYCTSKFGGECPGIQKDLFDEDASQDFWDDTAKKDEELSELAVEEFHLLGFKRHPNWPAGTVLLAHSDQRKPVRNKFKQEGWTKQYPTDKTDKWYVHPTKPIKAAVEYEAGVTYVTTMDNSVAEAVVEVPAGLRGEDAEMGGLTSRDAERFLADLAPDDSVDTEVIDPESGEVLDWPTQDTRRAQDDAEQQAQMDREDEEDDDDFDSLFSMPYIPGAKSAAPGQVQGFDGMDRAQEDLGKLKYDSRYTDFYDITWKSIEDLVDDPQQYYDGDYDIGWDMPVAIKRVDGEKFTDEDHANFRRLSSLFRAATYNIGIGYAGTAEGGTAAHFYPSFY